MSPVLSLFVPNLVLTGNKKINFPLLWDIFKYLAFSIYFLYDNFAQKYKN